MSETQIISNPFSQMINPGAVFFAVENSKRLATLQSRICRPLDKPPVVRGDSDAAAFDAELDQSDQSDQALA